MARSLRGLDENSAAAANLYLDNTERFRKGLGCTVLTVAHMSNKGSTDNNGNKKPNKTPDFRGSLANDADLMRIAEIITKEKLDSFARGITHKEMAEKLCGDKPDGGGEDLVNWQSAVNNTWDRIRKKQTTGFGCKAAPGIGAQKNEWRWWQPPVEG